MAWLLASDASSYVTGQMLIDLDERQAIGEYDPRTSRPICELSWY